MPAVENIYDSCRRHGNSPGNRRLRQLLGYGNFHGSLRCLSAGPSGSSGPSATRTGSSGPSATRPGACSASGASASGASASGTCSGLAGSAGGGNSNSCPNARDARTPGTVPRPGHG